PLPRYVPQDVLKLIAKYRPSVFPGAPSIYMSLLQQKDLARYNLHSIRICVSGSAPLPRDVFLRFQEVTGASILEGYGLTEASPITHCNPLGQEGQRANSIGMPIPGTDARIVDMEAGGLSLPPGKLGEMVVRGPQVMKGYWKRPDETANALRNGWLYTGDLATMDEDGYFYIVDRKKDMVIVGGYNVYPREVDEVLLANPKIADAVTVGISDGMRGETLKAYVVPEPGESLTKADVVSWCRARLASYKVPRLVEFRAELPKTIVGKVLRRALREEEEARRAQAHARAEEGAKEAGDTGATEAPAAKARDDAPGEKA
ncbi:MAG: AMP-binding protein, partial [Desulfovibrio sp.]|nr:AMP-binding protein [Desulfovibrio sp.]